MPLDHFLVLKL
uniref:Uncharacterized protein n=1 Tax=Rhizophora mucronata TaxID=61149 RepID=A0A2P2P557_RHIMU